MTLSHCFSVQVWNILNILSSLVKHPCLVFDMHLLGSDWGSVKDYVDPGCNLRSGAGRRYRRPVTSGGRQLPLCPTEQEVTAFERQLTSGSYLTVPWIRPASPFRLWQKSSRAELHEWLQPDLKSVTLGLFFDAVCQFSQDYSSSYCFHVSFRCTMLKPDPYVQCTRELSVTTEQRAIWRGNTQRDLSTARQQLQTSMRTEFSLQLSMAMSGFYDKQMSGVWFKLHLPQDTSFQHETSRQPPCSHHLPHIFNYRSHRLAYSFLRLLLITHLYLARADL